MRREEFSLAVSDAAWVEAEDGDPRMPTLTVRYEGDPGELEAQLAEDEDADLAVRLQRRADTGEAEAIVALTHRLTGDYILELTAEPEEVLTFTRAARRYGETEEVGPWYRARVVAGGEELANVEL